MALLSRLRPALKPRTWALSIPPTPTRRNLYLAPPYLLDDYIPRYHLLSSIEASKKRSLAYAHLRECNLCPRLCGVNRYEKTGMCLIGAETVKVGTIAPHFGEEPFIQGHNGSGSVFFSGCNMRCVFCQVCDARSTLARILADRVPRTTTFPIRATALTSHRKSSPNGISSCRMSVGSTTLTLSHQNTSCHRSSLASCMRANWACACPSSTTHRLSIHSAASTCSMDLSTYTCPTSRCGTIRQASGCSKPTTTQKWPWRVSRPCTSRLAISASPQMV